MQFSNLLAQIKSHAEQTICIVKADGTETIKTFSRFADDVETLARRLKEKNIGRGMRVGLLGNNSYEWLVWDVALISLGCVSVAFPVDSFEKTDEDLVKKYQLSYLAVSDELGFNTSETVAGIIPLEINSTQEWFEPAAWQLPEQAPETLSLAFSSGTTGRLKGLTISSLGTENLISLFHQAFSFREDDSHLIFLPFSGYQQRMIYYGCLYFGAGIIVVPYLRLFHELRRRRPTFVIAPPMFYETIEKLAKRPDDAATAKALGDVLGGNIRCVITGMAPIRRETLSFYWDHGIELYEAYGITEAGMVAWNKPADKKVGTLGKVAEPGTVILADDNEVIVCRDKPLSLGYFESSEEDRKHTFPRKNTVATGDIARFDEDGYLSIVGRKKDIIVTKTGEKFHPEPIEIMLNNCHYVAQCVVLGGDDLAGVVALINLTDVNDVAHDTVKQHVGYINEHLPDYQKITKTVFITEEFSVENGLRTQNLKLNRKAIRSFYEQLR